MRPALPRVPAPVGAFGYYWEMTHDRSGEVVGSGFSRDERPHLREQAGYSYRWVELMARPATASSRSRSCKT